ncbi:hypothetical protein D3C77_665090 [compost metagenome]
MQYARYPTFIAFGVAVKHAVKPAEETALAVMMAFGDRLENSGAQGRGEDHGDQYRKHHCGNDSDRELAINGAGGAAEEGHGNKYR